MLISLILDPGSLIAPLIRKVYHMQVNKLKKIKFNVKACGCIRKTTSYGNTVFKCMTISIFCIASNIFLIFLKLTVKRTKVTHSDYSGITGGSHYLREGVWKGLTH